MHKKRLPRIRIRSSQVLNFKDVKPYLFYSNEIDYLQHLLIITFFKVSSSTDLKFL